MTFSTSLAAVRRFGLAFSLLALLAACSKDKPLPPCPSVRVDNTTAAFTQFREGGGHDLNDVEYEVRLLGYKGICDYKDKGVDVIFDLSLEIAPGPAAKSGRVPIYYFVAVPQFFPDPAGKRVVTLTANLEPGKRERISENGVRIFIPLSKEEPAAAYDVYVGLQLTPEQLAYNRAQQQRR